MEENKVLEEIYQTIEKHGLMSAIRRFFDVGTNVQLPFSESACKTTIDTLNLSVRSFNCLKRAGLHTVDKVIGAMQENKLLNIHGLGKGSMAEINVTIYEFGYSCLTERNKRNFVKNLLESNKDIFKGTIKENTYDRLE